jgi:group I intron endonuclease
MAQVYAIHCYRNEWRYVGCTKSGVGALKKRFREHRCLLRGGKHAEKVLQDDWNRYGEKAFTVITLQHLMEDAPLEDKRAAELRWMDHYRVRGRLYNANQNSFSPTSENQTKRVEAARKANTGRVQTPEANEKRRLAQLGKPKNHGAKVSAAKKALGQKPTLEAAKAGGKRAAELGIPSLAAKIGNAKRKEAKLKI